MLPFSTYDVFTDIPYSGNPLAIVEKADGLSTAQMQTIAREFNLSETIFVQTPKTGDHTAKVRIFFPTAEIPFAGHPTIGCAIHLAAKGRDGTDWAAQITLEEEAGLVPVTVTCVSGNIHATFTAPIVPHAPPRATPDAEILTQSASSALGLTQAQIGPDRPAVWSGGPTFLYVPVVDVSILGAAKPCEPQWTALMEAAGVDSAYLYASRGALTYQSRMFSPTAGIPEDPATGSASAILAAQLLANGHLENGTTALTLRQGVEMGRPSDIGLSVDVKAGEITAVRVSGSAVPISSGQIAQPMPQP